MIALFVQEHVRHELYLAVVDVQALAIGDALDISDQRDEQLALRKLVEQRLHVAAQASLCGLDQRGEVLCAFGLVYAFYHRRALSCVGTRRSL